MQFKHKLLFVSLAILVFTLLLSSLLSLASFDKIYSGSLVSTYEVSGKNLHRKIQSALRFGKPLESFTKMGELLDEARKRDAAISRIDVVGPDKTLLYTTAAEKRGDLSPYSAVYPDFSKPDGEQIDTELIEGRYVTFMPLHDRGGKLVGYLNLEFPRQLVYQRLQSLALDNLHVLAPIVAVAGLLLILLIRRLATMPIDERMARLTALSAAADQGQLRRNMDWEKDLRGDEFDPLILALAQSEGLQDPRLAQGAGRPRRGFGRRIMLAITLVVAVGQGIYAYLNVNSFQQSYFSSLQQQGEKLADYLRQDIEHILKLGIPIQKLIKIDDSLAGILAASPDIEWIYITDLENRAIYHANREQTGKVSDADQHALGADFSAGADAGLPFSIGQQSTNVRAPVRGKTDERAGYVQMRISLRAIHAISWEIVLDIASVILVSLLITFMFLEFFIRRNFTGPLRSLNLRAKQAADAGVGVPVDDNMTLMGIAKEIGDGGQLKSGKEQVDVETFKPRHAPVAKKIPYHYIRPFVFLFFIAYNLPLSFFPLFVDTFQEPLWGLPSEVMIGLPISLFMLVFALSMLSVGHWLDKAGWYAPLLTGTAIFAVGFLATAFADSYLQLLLYRVVTAVGLGIGFMGFQQFVVENTDGQDRQIGFASFLSAFFAGEIVGAVIGGILADRLGYTNVFLLSGAVSFLTLVGMLRFFRHYSHYHQPRSSNEISFSQIFSALRDREFLAVMIFQAIPAKIALVGFLMYFVPLYLAEIGTSQADIARIIMCYALTMVIAGQWLSPRLSTPEHRKYYILSGGLVTGVAMILFSLSSSTYTVLLAVALLGLAHALSLSSQTSLIAETHLVKTLGVGKGLGVFRFWERTGNVAGPFIMAALVAASGYQQAIEYFGLGVIFSSLLYLVLLPKNADLSTDEEHLRVITEAEAKDVVTQRSPVMTLETNRAEQAPAIPQGAQPADADRGAMWFGLAALLGLVSLAAGSAGLWMASTSEQRLAAMEVPVIRGALPTGGKKAPAGEAARSDDDDRLQRIETSFDSLQANVNNLDSQIDQGLKVQAQRMQRSQDELQTSNQALQSQLQELSDKLDGLKERLEED